MSIADILISDTSSIRFDFSLVYNKPVITLSVDSNMMSGYERECLDYDWIKETDHTFWPIVDQTSIKEINNKIEDVLLKFNKDYNMSKFEKLICNFGESAKSLVDRIEEII